MIKLKLSLLLLGVLLGFFSCTQGLEGSGKALVNIRLIDAPGDFDEAWIEILGVEVLQNRTRVSNGSPPAFIAYQQADQQVNLSKLVGEGVLLIGRTEIPVGDISQLNLILGEDHYLMKDGEKMTLNLSSPDDANVEITVDYTMEESFSYDIYLDFELEKSIISTSDSSQFFLSPAVRSFLRSETSEMGGRILPVEARPVLFAIQGSDTVTTMTDAKGTYLFRGLKEGIHTLSINPREPYLDTLLLVETVIGKTAVIEDIDLRMKEENLSEPPINSPFLK